MRNTLTPIYYSLFTQTINSINKDKDRYTCIFMTSKSTTRVHRLTLSNGCYSCSLLMAVIWLHFEFGNSLMPKLKMLPNDSYTEEHVNDTNMSMWMCIDHITF